MNKAVLYFMLMIFSGPALAEMEVITLQHRSAAEVLPVIRPLLDKDGVASALDNRLVLRSSARNLAEIKKLLATLDIAPRRLKITVLQNVDSETMQRLISASASAAAGRDARVSVSGGMENDGGLALEDGQGDDLDARLFSTRSLENENQSQQIQVLEGSRALVRTGQSVPVRQQQVVQTPWNPQVTETTVYRDADSGFYVLPRLNGDQVTVEISSQNDQLAADSNEQMITEKHQLSTTVSGRLGEWMVLGDTEQLAGGDGYSISTRSLADAQQRRNVLLKVEEIGK